MYLYCVAEWPWRNTSRQNLIVLTCSKSRNEYGCAGSFADFEPLKALHTTKQFFVTL